MKHLVVTRWRQVLLSMFCLGALFLLASGTTLAAGAPTNTDKCKRDDLKCIITLGDKQVAERQEALKKLSGKVAERLNKKDIDSTQAAALQSDISTNQAGLSILKGKLDAETSAQAALQDAKAIHTQFRIYVIVLPRDYSQLHIDVEATLLHKLQGLEPKLTERISKAPAAKQAEANKLFSDYKTQLSNAQAQIAIAQSKLPLLTPASFNVDHAAAEANKKAIRKAEKDAHQDLHKAAKDLHEIAEMLEK